MSQKTVKRSWIYALLAGIGVIVIGRWLPHPPNFTPMLGALLFSAAFFKKYKLHFLVPIVGLWISDLFLNNLVFSQYFEGFIWFSQPFLYSTAAFVVIALIASVVFRRLDLGRIAGMTIIGTALFFLITNFGAWLSSPHLYPRDLMGLSSAYIAGLPFLLNSLLGDIFYVTGFFGVYYLINRKAFTVGLVSV
ncbi:MAG: DUF6580 family putative transport protein [Saprospiraceae bacterium]|nr:DUF6580 family putative transport protein [Saprospiraceae bacterium]